MSLRRRDFLLGTFSGLGALTLAGLVPGCSEDAVPAADADAGDAGAALGALPVDAAVFAHGVASGDPLADRVILWTRVTTTASVAVTVRWVVARDAALTDVAAEGEAVASADADYTVKVDPTGLAAGTTYYYAFAALPSEGGAPTGRSVVGRTRTLPAGDVARLRLAVTSCANYNNGYFNAYGRVADRNDLDVWVHLGDYIYEYADGRYGNVAAERPLEPKNETVTLDDYRKRYAHYRTDADLQEAHRQHPIVAVWDDHETANDSYRDGAENHQPEEGDWNARKLAGTRAFVEWLPVRAELVPGQLPKIYRELAFGNLVDLVMLDTRLAGRDKAPGDTTKVGSQAKGTPADWADPARQLLGAEQEAWLGTTLGASKARGTKWRLLGNQVVFAPTKDPRDGGPVTTDFWDGYQATRGRVIDKLESGAIDNVVVLTGDIHTSWAMDVPPLVTTDPAVYDPATGKGSVAVELVCPAVTSQALEGDPLAAVAPNLVKQNNPHIFFNEVTRKGYLLVDVTPERVQAEWYFVADHLVRTTAEALAATYTCASGSAHLVVAAAPSAPRSDAPARVV